MLYESNHLRVTTDDGVATLWLAFPGSPVNALSPGRVAEVGRALDRVLDGPHLDALVIRSGLPAGFCDGYAPGALAEIDTDDEAAAFALAGQRVFRRIAAAEVVTLAFIEGPCVGPGLELALACDYRLAVAGPDSAFGFPDAAAGIPPCWGASTRLKKLVGKSRAAAFLNGGDTLTAREARACGLVDHAFSERRGKIELRTWLDRVQANPAKPRRSKLRPSDEIGFAVERAAFRAATRENIAADSAFTIPVSVDVPPIPELVAVHESLAEIAVEAVLRGSRAVILGGSDRRPELDRHFAAAVRRGRATPLESAHARSRVTFSDDPHAAASAGLIVADAGFAESLRPKPAAVVAVVDGEAADFPRAVGVGFSLLNTVELRPAPETCPQAVASLAAWLPRLGYRVTVRHDQVEPPITTRLAA